jgi:hypothetical protein
MTVCVNGDEPRVCTKTKPAKRQQMNWVAYGDRIRKCLVCTQCIFAYAFLILLVPVLLISAWLFVTGG